MFHFHADSWFVFLVERNSKEIIALKRVPSIRGKEAVQSLSFDMEGLNDGGMYIYTLFVMSDSYLDLDQYFDIRIKVQGDN